VEEADNAQAINTIMKAREECYGRFKLGEIIENNEAGSGVPL